MRTSRIVEVGDAPILTPGMFRLVILPKDTGSFGVSLFGDNIAQ
jgi:hypothetical protein